MTKNILCWFCLAKWCYIFKITLTLSIEKRIVKQKFKLFFLEFFSIIILIMRVFFSFHNKLWKFDFYLIHVIWLVVLLCLFVDINVIMHIINWTQKKENMNYSLETSIFLTCSSKRNPFILKLKILMVMKKIIFEIIKMTTATTTKKKRKEKEERVMMTMIIIFHHSQIYTSQVQDHQIKHKVFKQSNHHHQQQNVFSHFFHNEL